MWSYELVVVEMSIIIKYPQQYRSQELKTEKALETDLECLEVWVVVLFFLY